MKSLPHHEIHVNSTKHFIHYAKLYRGYATLGALEKQYAHCDICSSKSHELNCGYSMHL